MTQTYQTGPLFIPMSQPRTAKSEALAFQVEECYLPILMPELKGMGRGAVQLKAGNMNYMLGFGRFHPVFQLGVNWRAGGPQERTRYEFAES